MLIFLPGLLCDASFFAAQLDAVPESKAISGYGTRDRLEAMAQYVLDQAPARFDLFGHSMGGRVALEVYRLAPERVRRLALASTGVHPVREGEPEKRSALQQLGREQGFAALIDRWLPPMIGEAHREDEKIVRPLRDMCLAKGQEVFDAQIAALLNRPSVEDLLPRISCPTLVMVGSLDEWSPVAQHEEIAAAISDAELIVVPNAGHMLMAEAPEAVNAAIMNWLDRPE